MILTFLWFGLTAAQIANFGPLHTGRVNSIVVSGEFLFTASNDMTIKQRFISIRHWCASNTIQNGSTCACPSGYYLSGSQCLDCPSKATCFGNDFTCNSGYYRYGTECALIRSDSSISTTLVVPTTGLRTTSTLLVSNTPTVFRVITSEQCFLDHCSCYFCLGVIFIGSFISCSFCTKETKTKTVVFSKRKSISSAARTSTQCP